MVLVNFTVGLASQPEDHLVVWAVEVPPVGESRIVLPPPIEV